MIGDSTREPDLVRSLADFEERLYAQEHKGAEAGSSASLTGPVHISVKNTSGGILTKGTAVYATGSVGASGAVEVQASDNTNTATMPALGLLDADLGVGDTGSATILGVIRNVDTSSYTINDELWINGSGTLQNTRPTSGLIQKIGRVVRAHATTGEILVLGAGRTNDVPFPLYVDHTNQRVGIGTTSPVEALDVNGNINIAGSDRSIVWGAASETGPHGLEVHDTGALEGALYYRTSPNSWSFEDGAGNKIAEFDTDDLSTSFDGGTLFVDAANNRVGIGTTSVTAGHVLETRGAVLISSTAGVGNSHFPFTDGRFYYTADPETGGTGDHVFRHYSGGSYVEQMRILENGNVGIGTSSPNHSLSFGSPANGTRSLALWENGTAFYGLGNDSNRLAFYASNSAGTAERMVINSSGQVGIGTTAPTAGYELDVIGDGRFSSSVYAQLHNSNSNQSRDKLRVWNSGTYSIGMKSGYKFGYLGGVGTGSDYAMSFQMSNSTNRGWWWGDTGHSDAQGAMSLTTQGQLYVATRIHVGGGESRTNPSTSYNLVNSGSTYLYGNVTLGTLPGVSGYYTVRRRNSDGLLGYASSSQRYKENVADADEYWRNIYKLRPVTFDWREFMFETEPDGVPDDRSDFGLIAEEVAVHLPEVVTFQTVEGEGDDPVPDAVDYEKLSVFYLSALQDLEARVAALEN